MESFGEIKFTLGSKIKLTISEKPAVPSAPRPAGAAGAEGSTPYEGPHIVTALSQADCLQIWEEARRANKLHQLMALFEKSNKALLQRLKDNTMTARDETFMVNLLCQTGVIRMKRLANAGTSDEIPKRIAVDIHSSTPNAPPTTLTIPTGQAFDDTPVLQAGTEETPLHIAEQIHNPNNAPAEAAEMLEPDYSVSSSPGTSASVTAPEDRSETSTPSTVIKTEPGLIKSESEGEGEEIGEYHVVAEGDIDSETGIVIKEEADKEIEELETENNEVRQDVEMTESVQEEDTGSQHSSTDLSLIKIKQEKEED
ncbi:uncharacterized protein [Ptychodera flava]|uniref:uncharacterized protein n=1 Tax=Ptychodera flava TaxID=63121 RepID=UPI003969E8AA